VTGRAAGWRARGAQLAALLAVFGTGACAPAVLWSRHTGDRLTGVEVRRRSGQTWLVAVDKQHGGARESGRFDDIAFHGAVFTERGGHFAFAARRGTRWHLLRDLTAGPGWDGVAAPTFDAGGGRLAYAAEDAAGWRLVVDGAAGPVHAEIAEPITFSEDGARVGYVAIDPDASKPMGRCVRVIAGGAAGACWRGVTALAVGCTPEQDTYVAIEGGDKLIVRGGAPLGRYDDVRDLRAARCGARWTAVVRTTAGLHALVDGVASAPARHIGPPAFGPGGARVAYPVERDGWRMNVDGTDGERFDAIGSPVFSADGAHVGYLGDRQGRRWLVVNGVARAVAPTAYALALGPDGRRVAYLTGSAAHPAVVCDGVTYPFPLVVEDTVSFSRDGRHWGVLAGDPAERRLFVAVDGRPARRFDTTELFGSVAASATGAVPALLRGWVAAEMEILLAQGAAR
jgi:hypothetical protein